MKRILYQTVLSLLMVFSVAVFADYTQPAESDSITAEVWQMDEFVLNGQGDAKLIEGESDDPANVLTIYEDNTSSNAVAELISGPTVDFGNALLFTENAGQADTAYPKVTARTSPTFLFDHEGYFKAQMWFNTYRLGQHQVIAFAQDARWAISTQVNNLVITLWFADGTNSGNKLISDMSTHINEWLYVEVTYSNKEGGKLEATVKNADASFEQSMSATFLGKKLKGGSVFSLGGEVSASGVDGRRGFYGAIDSFKLSYPPDYLAGDVTKDGYVDIADLNMMVLNWLSCTDMDNSACFE